VNVNVVGSGFSVGIEFKRQVYYFGPAGDIKRVYAATWREGAAGTHGRDSEYIIRGLDAGLDKFLNQYLKANGK